jgi:hypothetical protein
MDVSTKAKATVLSVKQYPSEEFGVLLHGTGAVVTLRDVKIFIPEGPVDRLVLVGGSHNTRDIVEGTELVLNDVGAWDVNTTALHHARVTISANGDTGIGCASDSNNSGQCSQGNYYNTNNDRYGSGATDYNVPSRRKHHRSMM